MNAPTDPIRDYIAANRDKYTAEAIRAQLLAAGHDPAAVDAELARLAATPPTAEGRSSVATYVWVVFWIGAAAILVFTGMGMGILGIGWLLAYGFIGRFAARRLSRMKVPSTAIGWAGVIILAPLAFLLIGGGICAATLAIVLSQLNI